MDVLAVLLSASEVVEMFRMLDGVAAVLEPVTVESAVSDIPVLED